MKKGKKVSIAVLTFLSLLLSLLCIQFASAYYPRFGYYGGPANLLSNEWIVFAIFFIIIFALIYFSLGKAFKGNIVIPVVIAGAIAFLAAAGIQREWYFMQQPIITWVMIIVGILVLLAFFKAIASGMGLSGLFVFICLLWAFSPLIIDSFSPIMISKLPMGLISFLEATYWLGVIFLIGAIILFIHIMRMRIRHGRPLFY